MAGKIVADQLEHSTAGSLDTQFVVNGSAKHMVWADTNTSNTIRKSLNNSSITDNGTGDYTFVATSAFSDIYSYVGCCTGSASDPNASGENGSIYTTTSSCTFITQDYNGSTGDADLTFLSVGDLA